MFIGTANAGKYCSNRITEWILAACMLNWGLTTFATPLTISKGAFRYLSLGEGLGIPWQLFATVMTVVGLAWIAALIFNGKGLPWTARARWFCSCICMLTLAYMALCLAYITKDTGTLSLGVGSHALWALAALYSCLRAGIDALGEDDSGTVNVAVFDGGGVGPNTYSAGNLGPVPDVTIVRRDANVAIADVSVSGVHLRQVPKAEG